MFGSHKEHFLPPVHSLFVLLLFDTSSDHFNVFIENERINRVHATKSLCIFIDDRSKLIWKLLSALLPYGYITFEPPLEELNNIGPLNCLVAIWLHVIQCTGINATTWWILCNSAQAE